MASPLTIVNETILTVKTSDSLDKLAPALLAAQQSITFASRDATNPHFKNRYADLPAVIDAIKPALNKAGIAFLQFPSPSDAGILALTTRLLHNSGQFMEDTATCPLPKADPQGFGSAMTYLRRYSLAAITGLYQDDDDGEAARPSSEPSNARKTQGNGTSGASTAKVTPMPITEASKNKLASFRATEAGEKACIAYLSFNKLVDFDQLTESEAQEAIAWIYGEVKSTETKRS